MRGKLTLLTLFFVININCFSQSFIFQLLYDNSWKKNEIDSNNETVKYKNLWSIDLLGHYMGCSSSDRFAIAGGGVLDLGLKFYDLSNVSKKNVTRFELGFGLSGSMQVRYQGFWNGVTIGAIPVLLFSGWRWGEFPRVCARLKLTADVNINFVNLGICYYPFNQRVYKGGQSYFFEPTLQFRLGIIISSFDGY
jgi:hypothetical protein